MDYFAKVNYPGLNPERISRLVRHNFLESNSQAAARQLFVASSLGIKDSELKLALGRRVVDLADET